MGARRVGRTRWRGGHGSAGRGPMLPGHKSHRDDLVMVWGLCEYELVVLAFVRRGKTSPCHSSSSLSDLPLSTYMPISLPPISLSLHISPSSFLRSPFLPPSLAHCRRHRGQTFCKVLIISKDHCSPTSIAHASLPPTHSS